MAYGLGSRNTNRWVMGLYAVAAVVWSTWRLVRYGTSDDVQISVEPQSDVPPIPMFGGQLRPGNVVELSVAKADVDRLGGFIDFLRYGEIIMTLVFILVAMVFLYRFCDRVIDGRPFSRGATVDLGVLGVSLALFPFVTGMLRQMGTNSVVGALELTDVVETARSFDGIWLALVVAAFLQFVYAAIQQGAALAKNTEGLV